MNVWTSHIWCLFSLWWPIYLSLPRLLPMKLASRPFVTVAGIVENVASGDYFLLLGWSLWVGWSFSCIVALVLSRPKTIQRASWTWLERRSLLGSSCELLVSCIAEVFYTFTKQSPAESLHGVVSRSCVIYIDWVKPSIGIFACSQIAHSGFPPNDPEFTVTRLHKE